jgi:hypothetical protein
VIDVMGGGQPPGWDPPRWSSDEDDGHGPFFDEDEQEDTETVVDNDESEEEQPGLEQPAQSILQIPSTSFAVQTPSSSSGVQTPSTSSGGPKTVRKKDPRIVRQDDLWRMSNPNRSGGKTSANKPTKKPNSNSSQAKHIARAEKGGINYGQSGIVGMANKNKVKVAKVRPHTTGGTGNSGAEAHDVRNGRAVQQLKTRLNKKLQDKGTNLNRELNRQKQKAKQQKREKKDDS